MALQGWWITLVLSLLIAVNVEEVFGYWGLKGHKYGLFSNRDASTNGVSTLWMEQKLDHFGGESSTWKQRYFAFDKYGNKSSKIVYLVLGGESALGDDCPLKGSWTLTAEKHSGLIFCLEHRYYGESQPASDLSTENLRYLSSRQALADAENFVSYINANYSLASDTKWIVYGGSYSGSLAVWLKYTYPKVIYGAVSYSGPLEAVLDFKEYLQIVENDLTQYNSECTNTIKSAYGELDEITTSCLEDIELYEYIDTSFKLCETIETSDGVANDISNFFEILTDKTFATVAQYNNHPNLKDVNINKVCDILVNESLGTPMDRLSAVNTLMLSDEECLDYKYDKSILRLSNITSDPAKYERQWVYQTCTEFGFFQTSSQNSSVFGTKFDVDFFVNICQDLFGQNFNRSFIEAGIAETNSRYQGKSVKVENVIYVNGDVDPWHVLGKLETSGETGSKAIVIKGASHCAGFYATTVNDSEEITAAKKEVQDTISQWLKTTEPNSSTRVSHSIFMSVIISMLGTLLL
ncbi:putative serine protease K12H4.7 [Rhynchophorus ferrugineus]|uniref:putative serine protease K12H4.7 n=1 Tax=Rhynchophorus ferrugineus TaxID=354439 RepID=UPI003FCE6B71